MYALLTPGRLVNDKHKLTVVQKRETSTTKAGRTGMEAELCLPDFITFRECDDGPIVMTIIAENGGDASRAVGNGVFSFRGRNKPV
jgi:hypothetical protein